MDFTDFFATLREPAPPSRLSPALQALWYDAHGQWQIAHDLVDQAPDADSAWVHAYLHRKEGDANNASYWYRRADRPVSTESPDAEWREIARSLLQLLSHRGRKRRKPTAEDQDDF